MKIESAFYTLEIPDYFTIESEDGINTIYNNNGVGAINISAYEIPDEYDFDIKNELVEFIESTLQVERLNDDQQFKEMNNSCYAECSTESISWRFWLIFQKNRAVFISYNSNLEYEGMESDEIDNIVNSIEI